MLISRRSALISAVLWAVPAWAADASGKVTVGKRPLADAVIRFHRLDPSTGRQAEVYATRTDPTGNYLLRGLKAGDYIVIAEKDGRRIYQGRLAVPAGAVTHNISL